MTLVEKLEKIIEERRRITIIELLRIAEEHSNGNWQSKGGAVEAVNSAIIRIHNKYGGFEIGFRF